MGKETTVWIQNLLHCCIFIMPKPRCSRYYIQFAITAVFFVIIVFGFLNGSYITVPEQGWPYTILAIGFIKGGNVQPLTGIDRRNTARFGIIVAGSASKWEL